MKAYSVTTFIPWTAVDHRTYKVTKGDS